MLGDMKLRDFALKTRRAYLHAVAALAVYFGRSPDLLSEEDVREFFLYLVDVRKLAPSTVRQHVCGIRFFYQVTLGRQWGVFGLIRPKRGRKLPVILSRDEVQRLIGAVHKPAYRVALLCAYLCGLRLSEVLGLRICDIDSERMLVRLVECKGKKDRYVLLPERLLEILREYWVREKPENYLFPSHAHWCLGQPMHRASLQRAVKLAAAEAGITKNTTVHTLRHCYATHLLECGVDLRTIQEALGHKNPQTTAIYTHVTEKSLNRLSRALEELSEGF